MLLCPREVLGTWGLRGLCEPGAHQLWLWCTRMGRSCSFLGRQLFRTGRSPLAGWQMESYLRGDLWDLLFAGLGESLSSQSAFHLQPWVCRSIPSTQSSTDAPWSPQLFVRAGSLQFSWSLSTARSVALWPSCFLTCFLFPRDFEKCIHFFVEEGEGKVIPR